MYILYIYIFIHTYICILYYIYINVNIYIYIYIHIDKSNHQIVWDLSSDSQSDLDDQVSHQFEPQLILLGGFNPLSILVGGLKPSENYEFVNWDDELPNWMEKYKSCSSHQPASIPNMVERTNLSTNQQPATTTNHCWPSSFDGPYGWVSSADGANGP